MEEKRVIFSFETEGDKAAVSVNGNGEEIISGLILMIRNNPEIMFMLTKAVEIYKTIPEDVFEKYESDEVDNREVGGNS